MTKYTHPVHRAKQYLLAVGMMVIALSALTMILPMTQAQVNFCIAAGGLFVGSLGVLATGGFVTFDGDLHLRRAVLYGLLAAMLAASTYMALPLLYEEYRPLLLVLVVISCCLPLARMVDHLLCHRRSRRGKAEPPRYRSTAS